MPTHRARAIALLAVSLLATSASAAPNYPARPVRIIVPFPAASSTDLIVRIVAQKLGERLGQPVVVENRPGAGGNIGSRFAAEAAPDGYTLLAVTAANAVSATLYRKLDYDFIHDFVPITQLTAAPLVIVTNPAQAFHTLPELIAEARRRPGELHFGSGGNGTINHLAGEMLNRAAGIHLVHVPYKSGSAAVADVLGNQIELAIDSVVASYSGIQAGKLRALAVTGTARVNSLGEVPTVAEAGIAGFQVVSWHGISAPKGTPHPVVDRLYREIAAVLAQPDVRRQFEANGALPMGTTPEDFARFVQDETAKWGAAVEQAGARLD